MSVTNVNKMCGWNASWYKYLCIHSNTKKFCRALNVISCSLRIC